MKVRKILRTARLVSWSYRLLSLVAGFAVIRIINEAVGIEGYGTAAYVLAIFAGLQSIDLGVLQSVSRYVARYQASEMVVDIAVFWSALVAFACVLTLFQILLLLIGLYFSGLFDFQVPIAVGQFIWLGVLSVIANVFTIGSSIFAGYQQYGLAGIAKISRVLIYVGVVVYLWYAEHLDVVSVLWASVCSTLAANVFGMAILMALHGREISFLWRGFPARHRTVVSDILSFSLFGWLITLSSIAITTGSVIVMGTAFSLVEVAQLQIAIVLLNGVTAFMTGGMSPLTTIAARCADGSPDSLAKRAKATSQLMDETILLSAVVLVFLLFHLSPFVGLLLNDEDRSFEVLSKTHVMILLVLLPCIMSMPFYLFKLALVGKVENARYGRGVAWLTLVFLVIGFSAAVMTESSFWLGAAIGGALMVRSGFAFYLGKHNLPHVSIVKVAARLLLAVAALSLLSLLCSLLPVDVSLGELGAAHFQGLLFGCVALGIYFFRRRLFAVLGMR